MQRQTTTDVEPGSAFHEKNEARKAFWRRALKTGVVTQAEVESIASDHHQRAVLLASLRLAGIQVAPLLTLTPRDK